METIKQRDVSTAQDLIAAVRDRSVDRAFTIWNQQLDPSTAITADLTEISTGRPNSPVRGSGIFVSGAGETGGRLLVRRLETGVIHCDAGIAHVVLTFGSSRDSTP